MARSVVEAMFDRVSSHVGSSPPVVQRLREARACRRSSISPSQGDVATITDESKLASVTLMTPQQLYELWERQPGRRTPSSSRGTARTGWRSPTSDRGDVAWILSSFFVGEERVTTQFSGLVMAYEDQSEEAFLTTQQVDEARHAQHFNRFYEQVVGYDGTFDDRLAARPRATSTTPSSSCSTSTSSRRASRLVADPSDRRGQGRLRHHLPHGHRGHARAHRPVLHHATFERARHPARASWRASGGSPRTSTATSPTAPGTSSRSAKDPALRTADRRRG